MKNLTIALIIAIIVTGIGGVISYYTTLKPINEMSDKMVVESTADTKIDSMNLDSMLYDISGLKEAMYQKALVRIGGYLIVIFCIITVLSYFVIERLKKHKSKKRL